MAIIVDIDNCIANDGWRIPRIRWDIEDGLLRYHTYHSLSPWDEPGNLDLVQGHHHAVLLFTSRPEMWREVTEEWLQRHYIKYENLLMRNNNEFEPSVVVKERQLETLWALDYNVPYDIVHAFDDRLEVVEMYRRHGIPATQRAIHNVCAYTPR